MGRFASDASDDKMRGFLKNCEQSLLFYDFLERLSIFKIIWLKIIIESKELTFNYSPTCKVNVGA